MEFHTNQKRAIESSISNNFESGIHFHATGTGKSWIALELLDQFQRTNPKHCNILWICEQKSILNDQFDVKTLESKGYDHILRTFFVFDYSRLKPKKWSEIVNSAAIWRKPILIIINRAFLVSKTEYKHIKIPIHCIIHDECHSITNRTTQEFYTHIHATNPDVRCLGFSATPVLTHHPFRKIQSQYTIYDACKDGVIVPPRIVWFKSHTGDLCDPHTTRKLCMKLFDSLPYQKIIVWCGMIKYCESVAREWSHDPLFSEWRVCVDTSAPISSEFGTYADFYNSNTKALMFCAGKHREGSDIPFLDGCVFMDQVSERTHKTFIQCIGRVLRRDPVDKKTYGLIIDINARSPIEVCNRMNSYLQPDPNIFPYHYFHKRIMNTRVNVLDVSLTIAPSKSLAPITLNWRRMCPDRPEYKERFEYEMNLFHEKDLIGYLLHAQEILSMTQSIPHVTRGSCGSSLVCYLLGISNIDPVKYNIQFARFLNRYRNTLPDIDFDFPHNLRDEVFLQIYLKWPNRVARISNHVYYHEKSALRKAVQLAGVRKRIPALMIHNVIRKLSSAKRAVIETHKRRLVNTLRTHSLHCGGIVFYPEGVPVDLKINKTSMLNQIVLNKEDVSKNKQFKIDILSSRALTQLFEAQNFKHIDFDLHTDDKATADLFARGDNIGITLAESPLMRRTLIQTKPRNIHDIAKCLAIIRPAAKSARGTAPTQDAIVYDDDAITLIQKYMGCDAETADNIRRLLTKGNSDVISPHYKKIFKDLRKYSFCKSHAYSYAQLVWQLGYMKAHHPYEFWKSTLRHCQSSYRKWVHKYEAKLVGVSVCDDTSRSIYAQHLHQRLKLQGIKERVKQLGQWWQDDAVDVGFYPDCHFTPTSLKGLIAYSRTLVYGKIKTVLLLVGYDSKKYVEIKLKGSYIPIHSSIGITCHNLVRCFDGSYETESDYEFW